MSLAVQVLSALPFSSSYTSPSSGARRSPNWRARLQAALGDTYRIERELGGGGMSRVFLAEETALGRQVVIKVLPPEMAAGVNVERFEREIQLAASLQHPHIVPLLTAGAVGDLLYYMMPFVEGESLRARLAREGELPVAEAMRMLREVADALAYAHAHGVVHRDIKPDNVLLSAAHAVVTDFGVAKAMSASSGGGHRSPRSASRSARRPTWRPSRPRRIRTWIIAPTSTRWARWRTRCCAAARRSRDVAAGGARGAHHADARARSRSYRPGVSAGAQRARDALPREAPADRLQSAAELLAQLEAVATPSGGMTPTGAKPTVSRAGPRRRSGERIRCESRAVRGRLDRVLAVVYVLRQRLGLPDWVLSGAAALLRSACRSCS